MINSNYANIITQARNSGATHVDFNNPDYNVKAITTEKDTLTLSSAAQAKMNGEEINKIEHTYSNPATAKELLANNDTVKTEENSINSTIDKSSKDKYFDEMMQNIIDKRLGIDREKLKEIDAMMEDIAKNENLSPEQKKKAMEELEKMKEKVIEESLDIKKQAERSFKQDENILP
jgi:hypothetical protein